MVDVQQYSNTIFDITDRATAPLLNLGKGLEGAQFAISKTTSLLNPLNAALGMIGAGLSLDKVTDIGSAFENSTIKMAQTMKMMGRGGDTFADAMGSARDAIAQVNTAAAALPGEAEDYTTALEMSGTTVQKAVGGYQETFDLIKDITAITISNQRSAAEGAMQLNKMLNADKGMLEQANDFSMKLIQNMRTIPGYANLTTQSFNAMKLEERVALVGKMRDTYADMIAESANTMDAIKGASMTIFKTFTQQATAPLFDGMKSGLKEINESLMQADGTATRLGQGFINIGNVISTKIVDGVKLLASGEIGASVLGAAAGGLAALPAAAGAMSAAGGGVAGLGAAGAVMGPLALLGMTIGELSTRTQFLDSMFALAGDALAVLAPVGEMVTNLFGGMSVLLADLAEGVLPSFLDAVIRIAEPLVWFAGLVTDVALQVASQLQPMFQRLWGSLSIFFQGVADFAIPVLKFLGVALYGLWNLISGPVIGVFNFFVDTLGAVVRFLGKVLSFMGEQFSWALEGVGTKGKSADPLGDMLKGFLDAFNAPSALDEAAERAGKAGAPSAPGARGGGGRVAQDFRFSRFEISQKFEEGFDPDRIAVAFANDLGKVGEQRSQSGFAPLFSVGL